MSGGGSSMIYFRSSTTDGRRRVCTTAESGEPVEWTDCARVSRVVYVTSGPTANFRTSTGNSFRGGRYCAIPPDPRRRTTDVLPSDFDASGGEPAGEETTTTTTLIPVRSAGVFHSETIANNRSCVFGRKRKRKKNENFY